MLIMRVQTYRVLQVDCVGGTGCICESPVHAAHELMGWVMLWRKVDAVLRGEGGVGLSSGRVLLEEVDEPVGGGVVGVDLCRVLELGLDLLGELFAQFDPDDGQGKESRHDGFSDGDELKNTMGV